MSTQDRLAEAISNLEWLAEHGCLTGVAAIIAERRAQIEQGDDTSGPYAAESALEFAELDKAGALAAAGIDAWPNWPAI